MIRFITISILLSCCYILQAQQTVGLFFNTPASFDGYTLFAPLSSSTTYLIDNCGYKVHSWEGESQPAASVYLLENGNLLRTAYVYDFPNFNGGGSGGRVELLDWESNLIWSYEYINEFHRQHHDIEILPNGNILILAWDLMLGFEAIQEGRDPSILNENELWMEQIVEVKPMGADGGEIVWSWNVRDHLIQDFDTTKSNFGVVAEHPELLDINYAFGGGPADWMHCNSIDYNPELDQILLSSRVMNEVYVIDHSTTTEEAASHSGGQSGKGGDFLYRWGNPEVYDRGTEEDRQLFGQHDAQWIEDGLPDEGKIMVFNNGNGRGYSSIDVLEPPVDSDGRYEDLELEESYGPTAPFWSYTDADPSNFSATFLSGAQRLPNGNTLICDGPKGNFFEVDENDSMVWKYVSPIIVGAIATQGEDIIYQNTVFRATRYAPDYPAFIGKELIPIKQIELEPLEDDCELTVSAEESLATEVKIYPNPASDVITIESEDMEVIYCYNVVGQVVFSKKAKNQEKLMLDIEKLDNGVYFLQIDGQFVKNPLIINKN